MPEPRPLDADWIDVSMPIHPSMPHWPGDPPPEVRRVQDMASGARSNLSLIAMSAHTGTHLDAPLHFLRDGAPIETAPLDALIGPARIIEIPGRDAITPADLEDQDIRPGERILFKTDNASRRMPDAFIENFVAPTPAAAEYLASRQIRTLGIDYLSIGPYGKDSGPVHRTLLAAGIWIIEGLDLSAVPPGDYEMICLPLNLLAAEGAPARVVIRPAP